MLSIRRAGPGDLAAATDVLVESHLDYVWERWAIPEGDRDARLRAVYEAELGFVAIPHGEVWMTDDGTSVAVWLHRSSYRSVPDDDLAALDRVVSSAFGGRHGVIDEVEREIGRHRPDGDWHLATMGTRPSHQRRGLGTAVLAPRLEALDGAKEVATLETSDVRNVAFYSRLGFRVAAHLETLPHDAPTTWVMVRDPV